MDSSSRSPSLKRMDVPSASAHSKWLTVCDNNITCVPRLLEPTWATTLATFSSNSNDERSLAHVAIRSGAIVATDAAGRARSAARARQQHKTYGTSQRRRKIVEEFFGWGKTISTMRRSKHIERFKIRQQAQLTAATYNLVRMCRLLAA